MDTVNRKILVIEDDEDMLALCTAYCEEAVEDLGQEKMVEVVTAATYDEALNLLQHDSTIRIASIDLALQRNEHGWRDEARAQDDVGGMKLLKHIHHAELPVLSVVVTGETLQSYATDALQTYGVIRFFEKSRMNHSDYHVTMMALLRYLDTADVLKLIKPDAPDSYRLFLRASEAWDQTLHFAKQAQAARALPQDVSAKMAVLRERMLDPMTRLPVSAVTEQRLKETIIGRETGWALLQVRIRNFEALCNTSGFEVGPMWSRLADLVHDVIEQQIPPDSTRYVGMLGNAGPDPRIVIIIAAERVDEPWLASLKKTFQEKLDASAPGMADQTAPTPGMPQIVPEFEIKDWNAAHTFFANRGELVARLYNVGGDSSYA